MPNKPLLEFTDRGIYCEKGGFYIDPWKPVDYAVITHAHADHAYLGHKHYLAHHLSKQVLLYRLGEIDLQTVEYGEKINKNDVEVSLHPAGHVIGSAQIRVEYKGELWVVSGDYKLEDDGISTPFEPIKCHHFISECTFGMPVYQWKPQVKTFEEMNRWWRNNLENGLATVIVGYSLGKAQRVLQNLDLFNGKVYTHGAIENVNQALRNNGVQLNPTERIVYDTPKEDVRKGAGGRGVARPGPGALADATPCTLDPVGAVRLSQGGQSARARRHHAGRGARARHGCRPAGTQRPRQRYGR